MCWIDTRARSRRRVDHRPLWIAQCVNSLKERITRITRFQQKYLLVRVSMYFISAAEFRWNALLLSRRIGPRLCYIFARISPTCHRLLKSFGCAFDDVTDVHDALGYGHFQECSAHSRRYSNYISLRSCPSWTQKEQRRRFNLTRPVGYNCIQCKRPFRRLTIGYALRAMRKGLSRKSQDENFCHCFS